jgi:alpha-D-xyloside xylohydrolase
MGKTLLVSTLFLAFALTSCTQKPGYEKLADGILLNLGDGADARMVKLTVVSESIIHVTASPTDSFPKSPSLVVVPQTGSAPEWSVEEAEGDVSIITNSLRAKVSMSTGEVVFTDPSGQIILQEKNGGGKVFTAATVENVKTHSIRQIFESSSDEAFYG